MGDYDWVGPLISAGSQYLGSQQHLGGVDQQNQLLQDAYKRALAMLQGGQLNYKPSAVGPVGPSAMQSVQADPTSILAQNEALQRLGNESRSGFDAIDRAAINKTMDQANMQEKTQRDAVLARLDPNSGAALAARMSAQQAGSNRAGQQAMDIAAASRKRALEALGQYGGLASKMRGQSFEEGATRANSMDAISKFNAELSNFNANRADQASQFGIKSQLNALGIASGEGGAYGAGLANRGRLQGQQTAGLGKGIAGVANARNEGGGTSDGGTSDPPLVQADDTTNWDNPYPNNYDIRDEEDK